MLLAYYARADRLSAEPSRLPELSGYRRGRMAAAKVPLKKQQGVCAELLLYEALKKAAPGAQLPPEIAVNENGKPFLAGLSLRFSLSHSGELAFCAVSDDEIGADVQKISAYDPRLAQRFFAAGERACIEAASDRDRAFTRIWALKESYIKALGLGLSAPLGSFDLCPEGEFLPAMAGFGFWHAEAEGCVFALCAKNGSAQPDEFVELNFSL